MKHWGWVCAFWLVLFGRAFSGSFLWVLDFVVCFIVLVVFVYFVFCFRIGYCSFFWYFRLFDLGNTFGISLIGGVV